MKTLGVIEFMETVIDRSELSTDQVRAEPMLVIKPTRGWGRLALAELWEYRELLWFMTWREVKGRYRQMALGPLWILIRPLVGAVMFSLVFGRLARLPSEGVPYPLFTFTALLPWTYFAGATTASVGSLVSRMNLISKVYFPRLIVPLSAVFSNLIDLAFSFVVLAGMMVFYGVKPSLNILALPFYVLLASCTSLAVGLWCSALAVKFRDLQIGISHGLQIWMFGTPVAYTATLVPERWLWLYQLNPMYWAVEGFRWSVLGIGQPPQAAMLIPAGIILLLVVTGAFIFRRTERNIVDLL
jgi:lipopolysaccharide transport system permease protein